MTGRARLLLLIGAVIAALALAIPAFGADPSPSTGAPGQAKDKPARADKDPAVQVTLQGTIVQAVDGKGRPTFTMVVDGTTWELSVGPKWYWGSSNPLAAHAGKSVTVTGMHRDGAFDLDVLTIDGKVVRAAGKPPWAGGPKAVGQDHPGWKGAAHGQGKGIGHGRANAPGQLKDKGPDKAPDGSSEDSDSD